MIQDVQMALSQELLLYPNGIAFSKLKSTWWEKYRAVKSYYCDKVSSATRQCQCRADLCAQQLWRDLESATWCAQA